MPGAWSDARHVIGLHLDADWLVQVPNSLPPFPSLPFPPPLPSAHTSQVHTHGIRAAGDPSSAAGAPVSKRRLSKHHRSCPPIRVWYQSMTGAPAVAQLWWRCRRRLCSPWPGAFIGISSFYYYSDDSYYSYYYHGSIHSFVLRATLRLAGAVPPQRDPGTLAPIPI